MTDTATKQAITQVDEIRGVLGRMKPQFAMALPKHVSVDQFVRVTMTAIQKNPLLVKCDRTSLMQSAMTACQLGLLCDGVMGQGHLVPFWSNKNKRYEAQFIPGYKGLIVLARNSGDVVSVRARAVYPGDSFEYEEGLVQKLNHKPGPGSSDAVTPTHFYAVAEFKDGSRVFEVMELWEVERIRNRSNGYKAAVAFAEKNKTKPTGPWIEDFVEMGKKTAIRRLSKTLPMDVQRAAALLEGYDLGRRTWIDRQGDVHEDAIEGQGEWVEGEEAAAKTPSKEAGKSKKLAALTEAQKESAEKPKPAAKAKPASSEKAKVAEKKEAPQANTNNRAAAAKKADPEPIEGEAEVLSDAGAEEEFFGSTKNLWPIVDANGEILHEVDNPDDWIDNVQDAIQNADDSGSLLKANAPVAGDVLRAAPHLAERWAHIEG